MYSLLREAFAYTVQSGQLRITDPSGRETRFGNGSGPEIAMRLTGPLTQLRMCLSPEYELGEAYMDGRLIMERGSIYDLLALLMGNLENRPAPAIAVLPSRLRQIFRRLQQYNPIGKAQKNVAHHYDLSGALYDLFLDRDRQYSCAYFESPEATLEDAQLAKKRHLAAKLGIKPGMRVLDIGSGWGGLGLYLAELCGAKVTGVTLSQEQYKLATERASQRGLSDRVEFRLMDYRHLEGPFDRIVSVGMFEHVGIGHYPEFFTKVKSLLAPDGAAVLHSINRSDGPGVTAKWLAKYIFPGGYIPALSEVVPVMEKARLYITDIEILRLHYAETLKEWRRRFLDHWARAEELYDARFCRMWEFYLAASEAGFRFGGMNNFQIQFALSQHALPLTRDYIAAEEGRLRQLEAHAPRLKSIPAG